MRGWAVDAPRLRLSHRASILAPAPWMSHPPSAAQACSAGAATACLGAGPKAPYWRAHCPWTRGRVAIRPHRPRPRGSGVAGPHLQKRRRRQRPVRPLYPRRSWHLRSGACCGVSAPVAVRTTPRPGRSKRCWCSLQSHLKQSHLKQSIASQKPRFVSNCCLCTLLRFITQRQPMLVQCTVPCD
jgi:hypothetical protein